MGKKLRIWIMRLVAVLIVVFMIIQLGSNVFNRGTSDTSDNTSQTIKKKKSQYTFVNTSNKITLEGIHQTILLPQGMKKKTEKKDENTGAVVYNYGSRQFGDVTIGVMIREMESGKGANLEDVNMVSMEAYAEGLKNGEFENTNYITFKGESNLFLQEVQTIYGDDKDVQYKYEVDYNIFDVENQNYYTISLFLISPSNPSKTDYLQVDRMGKEMFSKTRFNRDKVYDEYGLPAESSDLFNHIK